MSTMVNTMTDPLSAALARAVHDARQSRGLTGAALATLSGVSRAMIGKIERGEAQPTAALLARLSGALGMTLSELIAQAEHDGDRLARHADQPTWTDPVSGYHRRAVSPRPGGPLELVEVHLPAGAEVGYPAQTYTFSHHQIWVLSGELTFHEGPVAHTLGPGDCLELGAPQPCRYTNPGARPCHYLVALARRAG
jgi:transcriptional regulator with XRE-family HTH domain